MHQISLVMALALLQSFGRLDLSHNMAVLAHSLLHCCSSNFVGTQFTVYDDGYNAIKYSAPQTEDTSKHARVELAAVIYVRSPPRLAHDSLALALTLPPHL